MILVTKHPSFTSDDDDDDDDDAFDALKGRRSNNESSVATLTPRPFARPQMHACIDDDDDDDDDSEERCDLEEEEKKRKKRPKSSSRRRSIVSLATLRRRRRRRIQNSEFRIQRIQRILINNKKGKKEDTREGRIFSFFFSFFLSR